MSKRKKDKKRRRSRRHQAPASQKQLAHPAAQARFLPSEAAGSNLMLVDFELHGEAIKRLSPAVETLTQEAIAAIHSHDGKRAERLLKQALELEPDELSLLNNLATAYICQRRSREAEALIRDIHARHPDYLFGRVNMSQVYIRERRLDQAEEMLRPLFSRRRLHFTEFDSLCMGQINLLLARGQREAAGQWLHLWEKARPDHPLQEEWRRRVRRPRWWQRLLGKR